jgi:outer membrane protein TolC
MQLSVAMRDKVRWRSLIALVFGVGLGLGAVRPAAAQADHPLTLDDALVRARAHNRDLRAARARLDQSRTGIEQARAALLPSAAAQGKYTHNNKEVELALPGGGEPVVITKGEQLDFSVSASVPVIAPPAYLALSAANKTQRANTAQYEATEADVLLAVAQAYYGAAGADELIAARTHAVETARKTLDDAEARVAADLANQVDALRARNALLRAEQAQREAENTRARAYRALATLIDADGPIAIAPAAPSPESAGGAAAATAGSSSAPVAAGSAPAAAAAGSSSAPDLVTSALALRPELVAERESIAAATASSRAAALRWTPSLSAFGNLRAFNYEGFSGDKYAWAVGLTVDWVLYDGGVRDAQRHAAAAQRREAEARLDELSDSITDEVADASGDLDTKRSGVTTAQQGLELATETLRLIRAQYDAGTVKQLDVLAAQDALVVAEVGVVQARYDLALADLQLRRVTGAFPGPARGGK